MPIELKDYDIVSNDFKTLTGRNLFVDINEIPLHHRSAMYFTLSIGNVGCNKADDFKLSVAVRGEYGTEKPPLAEKGFLTYASFDPQRIINDIEALIANCDLGTLQDSLPCLREVFEWEFEGM